MTCRKFNVVVLLLISVIAAAQQPSAATPDCNGSSGLCVRSFGAKGDGVTDDTAAIDRAADAAKDQPLYFPKGIYLYNGSGRTGTAMKFTGTGKDSSVIRLGAGKYFIDDNQRWSSLQVRGLRFEGGAGAIRNRFNGANVADMFEVDDCYFRNYTNAAISVNATDDPYWKISHSTFYGANTESTIGVALSGWTDSTTLSDDAFINNHVHVKLGRGGNNAHIVNSEFIQFSRGRDRVSIWIVPATGPGYRNAGQGLTITASKFGNENLDPSDRRILYADEGHGEFFGDRMYSTSPSVGYIAGHTVSNILVSGTRDIPQPFVYSYTPNVSNCVYSFITSAGTPPSYILEFAESLEPDVSNSSNLIGPVQVDAAPANASFVSTVATNGIGAAFINDPNAVLLANDSFEVGPYVAGTSQAGFTNLQTAGITSYQTLNGAAKSQVKDSTGGDGVALFLPLYGLVKHRLTGVPSPGLPLWIEFDLKAGTDSPLKAVLVRVQADDGTRIHFQRLVQVPAQWRRYRFMFVPRAIPSSNLNIGFGNSAYQSGSVQVGRVNVYQAFEPINGNQFLGPVSLDGSLKASGKGSFEGVAVNSAGTVTIVTGRGVPAGNCTNGALYLRSDGGSGSTLYVCEGVAWSAK